MKYSELKQQLRKAGCYKAAEGKRHEMWFSPKTGNLFPVPRHDTQEIPPGTLNNIRKDAGLK